MARMNRLIFLLFGILSGPLMAWNALSQELEPNPNLQDVVVVFKTHFDIGYTDFAESVLRKYGSSMIEGALQNLDASMKLSPEKRFVWTLPGWPMQQILDRCTPSNKTRVEKALKEGSFVIHALPVTFETEASDLENLVRGLRFSADISKKYGLELPRDAKMTDVPSHSWILPTLLKNAGVDFLHLGCNPASKSPEIPLLFWWEGPDGSRLMTMYYERYYGTDLVSPKGWPFKTWMALVPTNDNEGAPTVEEVMKILDQIARLAPNAKIKIGRISDFYDLLIRENPDLPVVRGDMPDTWIHGFMSMPKEVKTSREVRRDIFALEALNTQLNLWTKATSELSGMIEKAAENSLLFDEHTFGLAMSHGQAGHWAYGDEFKVLRSQGIYDPIEKSWKEKADRIYQAEKKIMPNYKDELDRLANEVNIEGPHLVVYNPLPWPRTGMVKLQIGSDNVHGNALKDLLTGKVIPLTNQGNVIQFAAEDVPAMGYKTYLAVETKQNVISSLKTDEKQNTIENEYYKIQVDALRGRIKSIIDKRTKREMVDQTSDYGFGNYLYEHFSKTQTEAYVKAYTKGGFSWAKDELGRPGLTDEPYRVVKESKARVSFQKDELKVSAIMQFDRKDQNPHDYSVIITLYRGQPYVEINWAIHGKEAEPWPEAAWIPFSFNVKNPDFKAGRLGAVVDPAKDFIRGSNFDYFFLNTGVAVVDKQGDGYGVSSPDVPGISLGRPGLWRYSGDFIPKTPELFFNLYNNQWSTNFTEWIEGSWNTHFYIWNIEGYNNEALIIPSEEFRMPLKAAYANRRGSLPVSKQGICLSKKGIFLTAFAPNPDGEGLLLRLWEQAGESGDCTVELPEELKVDSAQSVNLRGIVIGNSIAVSGRKFTVNIEAYAPNSFILK
jgi:alpha-mannosidase